MLAGDGFAGLVVERDGTVVGAAFVDERGPIAGIGPVVVDPAAQDDGVGRALMEAAVARVARARRRGIRLVQTAYHYRSLALYAKLGFVVREPLSVVQGVGPGRRRRGRRRRGRRLDDVGACDALCARVHGHERDGELRDAIAAGHGLVVERAGAVTGYATGVGYGWHAVGETQRGPDGPARRRRRCSWASASSCRRATPSSFAGASSRGLRIVQQSTLMTIGLYNEPAGAWLPSVVY